MKTGYLRKPFLLLLTFFIICCLQGSDATTVEPLTEQELVNRSAIILVGKVSSLRSEWNVDHTQIHTIVDISVDSLIKGSLPDTIIRLRFLGGTVGDTTLWIVGSPTFETGQEILVFLRPDLNSLDPVVGFNQGKMSLEVDPTTGQKMIRERQILFEEYLRDITSIVNDQKGGK